MVCIILDVLVLIGVLQGIVLISHIHKILYTINTLQIHAERPLHDSTGMSIRLHD